MKKAVIYARFSSDRQNENSCKDQIDLCKAFAERNGFTVVDTFQDEAVSGASMINRFGLAQVMRGANNGDFEVLICEALDRLSRDQADLAQIRKELIFRDISIQTVQDGEVNAMHVGLKGLMGEMYLADLAQKTKRGLRAVVADGRQAGGKSYGYDLIGGKAGELSINEREASVVRRIFNEYSLGATPRQIAAGLNADKIPSPRGGNWNSSTINGSRQRKNGILQNQLYVGKIVWNRQRFIKDPSTGKRVSRPNPESEWITHDAPHLRIIDDVLFEKVTAIKDRKGSAQAHKSVRPKHVFSGLIKCGCCGSSMTVQQRDRIGCAGRREKGICDNTRTVARKHIEKRVLAALEEKLAHPDLISTFIKAYHDERRRLLSAEQSQYANDKKQLASLSAQIERIVDKIVDGTSTPAIEKRLVDMEREKAALETKLEGIEANNEPINLHPAIAEKYRRIVASLSEHMDAIESTNSRDQVFEMVRGLIDKITVTPTGPRQPVIIEVEGQLAALLGISQEQDITKCRGLLVAGARCNQYPALRFSA